jgi:taurine dioxygenase
MARDLEDAHVGQLESPRRLAPGDLAIWDERCTNHRALSDHFPANRKMRRCTVDGDRPFLRA